MKRNYARIIGAGLLLFAVGCGGGGGPQATFKEFQSAVKAKDGDKAWNLLSKESQGQLEGAVTTMKEALKGLDKMPPEMQKTFKEQMAKKMGMSGADLDKLDAKGLFTMVLKNPEKMGGEEKMKELTSATLENVKVEGDKATGTIKSGSKTDTILFVKEGGAWKITMPK